MYWLYRHDAPRKLAMDTTELGIIGQQSVNFRLFDHLLSVGERTGCSVAILTKISLGFQQFI